MRERHVTRLGHAWGIRCLALLFSASALAAEPPANPRLVPSRSSFQLLAGHYFSNELGPNAPFGTLRDQTFHYATVSLRYGYMLTAPRPSGALWSGAPELLFDFTIAPVTDGYADIVVGPSVLLRYNFTGSDASLVPYLQAGAGLVYSDAHQAEGQDAIGQPIEFLLQAQAGLRWRISPHCSLDLEAGWQHISNAGLAERNGGLNNLGGSIGFTYVFPARAP